MASMAWMNIGGGYHGYHTYFNYGHSTAQHRYDTDLAALMPLQNMNLVQPSAARARPWSAMPSPSLTQAVTASCSRCWPKQTRPGNAALRGHSAHLSVKAVVNPIASTSSSSMGRIDPSAHGPLLTLSLTPRDSVCEN
ncbi:hypothetical protein THAR02_02724 [Trichoderma harzianum]|uniref:Uncharacterized protein n=1 Tax=Trichoderma harzianum TaxID=5544 RepID=A0A0G0AJW7_TRIHA|nr:hypothetical protein THAR02_02724 [Trichoderma harzianum]